MIKIYFESRNYSEIVAIAKDEEIYMACLPGLKKLAKSQGMMVTESLMEDRQLEDNRKRRIKKNPRVYVGKLYPRIELAIDGDYVGTTAQFPSLKSALENLKEEFPMKKGKYLVAYYPGRPGMRRIKLKY
jgi:hypothetical protein